MFKQDVFEKKLQILLYVIKGENYQANDVQ